MLPFHVITCTEPRRESRSAGPPQNPRSFASPRLTESFLQAKSSPLSGQTSAVCLPQLHPLSSLSATLTHRLASIANKRLTVLVTPLDATPTKNTGEGLPDNMPPSPCLSVSVANPSSVLRILFHLPYPASPLLATLTKTAGVCTNNSQFRTLCSPLATHHSHCFVVPTAPPLCDTSPGCATLCQWEFCGGSRVYPERCLGAAERGLRTT